MLRIRHKKCDEARPTCSQCLSTGWKCDFLFSCLENSRGQHVEQPEWRQRHATNRHELAPPAITQSPYAYTLHDYDALHIQSYQDFVIKEFSATFEVALWQRVILQAARTEKYVRSAIIAIGALVMHKNAGYLAHERLQRYEYSLVQYNSAIRELNRRLDNSAENWELSILGAFLFTAFEVIQGREDRAKIHIRSAFAILKSMPTSTTHKTSFLYPAPENPLQDAFNDPSSSSSASDAVALLNAFSRLDPQASPFRALNSLVSSQVPKLPPTFTSISQAREYLLLITNAMHSVLSRATPENKSLPYSPLPSPLDRGLTMVKSALDTWYSRFRSLCSHLQVTDLKTTANTQVLLIHHCVAQIQASTHFFRDELVFDSYFAQFAHIVTLAKALTEADQRLATLPTSMDAGPCFIFDIGLVQPLFFAARKCRDGSVRRMAIEAMEKVRRKRVRDVQLLAGVARWITATEEEGLDVCDGVIAEERRLHDVELDFHTWEGSCGVAVAAWRRRIDGSREEVSAMIRDASWSGRANPMVAP